MPDESELERRQKLETRMQLLLGLAGELAAASTIEEIGHLAVHEGVAAVGAVSSTLWLCTGDRLDLCAHSARVPGRLERYQSIPMSLDAPVPDVVRSGEPIFFGSLAEYGAAYPTSHARVVAELGGEHALALLPVTGANGTLGVLCFTYDHVRVFDAPGRAFKALLARQCALAIERVRLQAEERDRREAAELLYEITASVNVLDDLDAIYKLALDVAMRGSGSQRAAILVFDAAGSMRFKAWRGLSETYRAAVDGHSPWKPDARDPAPVAVGDTETDAAWVTYRDVFRAEGIRALAFVPLVHQRKLIGKLMLYRDEPREFSARELQLTTAIAIHVAQAIERTRAYREEREARVLADAATRAREEILSVVSHDLRNPLGTIMIGASTLLALEVGDKSQRVRTIAERVHRQAERMTRLIEDLVDFAGIQAGRLSLERTDHAPEEILTEARDLFGPIAAERGLVFEAHTPGGLPHLECDSERIVQLISNLVSNAFKVTPKGGKIAIGAEPKDREVVFYVRDTGPGIAPEELPQLFERYWRSKQASYRGAGLGLSIAHGIVAAHGGRIWAESTLGVGSTFYFCLPS
jgi:signal transduction histidine kinase